MSTEIPLNEIPVTETTETMPEVVEVETPDVVEIESTEVVEVESPEIEPVDSGESVDDLGLNLVFKEKIMRSNTNNSLLIPNLSYLNYILSQIELSDSTSNWEFEVVVKSGSVELVKLAPAYFKHHSVIDFSKHLSKTEEGDKLELVVKPKHASKDFILEIKYSYEPSEGSLYYQNTYRISDLEDPVCTLMQDITQNIRPTRLEIQVDGKGATIQSVELEPKFTSEDFSGEAYHYSQLQSDQANQSTDNSSATRMVIDFTDEDFPDGVLNLLRYYRLNLKLEFTSQQHVNMDTPVHFLAYGFKVSV